MNKKYDVAVIFGGSLGPQKILQDFVKKRGEKGIELHKQGEISNLIMSGASSFFVKKNLKTHEAEAMSEYAVSRGIKKENIFLEEKSRDTIGNIYFSGKIIKKNKWKRIVCVTSCFHFKRAEYLFSKVMGNKYEIKLIVTDDCKPNQDMLKREIKLLKIMKRIFCFVPSGWGFVFGLFLVLEYNIIPLFADYLKKYLSS